MKGRNGSIRDGHRCGPSRESRLGQNPTYGVGVKTKLAGDDADPLLLDVVIELSIWASRSGEIVTRTGPLFGHARIGDEGRNDGNAWPCLQFNNLCDPNPARVFELRRLTVILVGADERQQLKNSCDPPPARVFELRGLTVILVGTGARLPHP